MNETDFKSILLRDSIAELPKSFLPASSANLSGRYDFYCSSSEKRFTDTFLQNTPSVIMGTGGVASVHFASSEYAYSTDTWGFRAKNANITTEYLYYLLLFNIEKINYFGFEGSGLKHLRKDYVRKLNLKVPKSRNAISRISTILKSADTLICKTKQLIEKYEKIKMGMMYDLFTRGIDEEGKLRQCHAASPDLYKKTKIGWIPKEWDFKPLMWGMASSPKNGYSPKEVNEWRGVYVLGLGCLTKDGFQPLQLKNAPETCMSAPSRLNDGDFLISRANTPELVGLCGIYKDIGYITTYPDLMMRLSLNSRVNAEFLERYLLFPLSRQRLSAIAVGTSSSMVKLNSSSLTAFEIVYPNYDEQCRIVQKLKPVEEEILTLKVQLKKLSALKNGLMQDLLTGKVSVKVEDKESEATHV